MSNRKNSKDTHSATSSPESADGASPCNSQDGTGLFGQALAPASRSHQQAKEKEPMTSDTSGLSSQGSSASAALQQSLESRLQARLGVNGSMEYRLAWKTWVTPQRRQICALRASAPRTSDSDCFGWLTPSANDDASGLPGAKMQPMLPAQVKMCGADTIEDARMATRGVSHPAFHCWLMGFPAEWNSCGASAMQSCRK